MIHNRMGQLDQYWQEIDSTTFFCGSKIRSRVLSAWFTLEFLAPTTKVRFRNFPNDARGKISNATIIIDGAEFQMSSDTAAYRQLLEYFRNKYPEQMKGIYDAAPTRTRFP